MSTILLFISVLSIGQISASRSVIGNAGTELSNATLQMSFTIGEVFTSTLQNTEIHTLGFQQSDRWFAGINTVDEIEFELFPNPARTEITVRSSSDEVVSFEVKDLLGRTVISGNASLSILRIDVSQLEEGKYYFVARSEHGLEATKGFITIH